MTGQTALVISLAALAAAYLARQVYQTCAGGCGGCSGGCGPAKKVSVTALIQPEELLLRSRQRRETGKA